MIDYFDTISDSAKNDTMLENDYHMTNNLDHNEAKGDMGVNKCAQIQFETYFNNSTNHSTHVDALLKTAQESYQESIISLKNFGYAFSALYYSMIANKTVCSSTTKIFTGIFKEPLDNMKIGEYSLFDVINNATTSLTFLSFSQFTNQKMESFNFNQEICKSYNKVIKPTCNFTIKVTTTAINILNSIYITNDVFTNTGESIASHIYPHTNNTDAKDGENKIQETFKNSFSPYNKIVGKSTNKLFYEIHKSTDYNEIFDSKIISKLLEKRVLKYLNNKSENLELTTDDYADSISYGVKNIFCKKILLPNCKTNIMQSIMLPYCLKFVDNLKNKLN